MRIGILLLLSFLLSLVWGTEAPIKDILNSGPDDRQIMLDVHARVHQGKIGKDDLSFLNSASGAWWSHLSSADYLTMCVCYDLLSMVGTNGVTAELITHHQSVLLKTLEAKAVRPSRYEQFRQWLVAGFLNKPPSDDATRTLLMRYLGLGTDRFRARLLDDARVSLFSQLWRTSSNWPEEAKQIYGGQSPYGSIHAGYARWQGAGWASLIKDLPNPWLVGDGKGSAFNDVMQFERALFHPSMEPVYVLGVANQARMSEEMFKRVLSGQYLAWELSEAVPSLATLVDQNKSTWTPVERAQIVYHVLGRKDEALEALADLKLEPFPAFEPAVILLAQLNPSDDRVTAYKHTLAKAEADQRESAANIAWLLALACGNQTDFPASSWAYAMASDGVPSIEGQDGATKMLKAMNLVCGQLVSYHEQLRDMRVLHHVERSRRKELALQYLGMVDKLTYAAWYGRDRFRLDDQ